MIRFILNFYKKYNEKINYLIVGGWNTIFGYFAYFVLYKLLSSAVHYLILLIPANIIAITNAYICYKFFVFKTKGNYLKEYLKFYLVYSISIILNFVIMPIFVELLKIKPLISQAIILFVTIILSYIGHKSFTFNELDIIYKDSN